MNADTVYVYRRRRTSELALMLFAQLLGFVGYLLIHINLEMPLPEQWPVAAAIWFGLGIVAHVVVRLRIPYADPLLLPLAFFLNGLGLAMIHRLDLASRTAQAPLQLVWTALGVALFVAVLLFFPDHRVMGRFPYLLFILGITLLMLPLVPGLGVEKFGAQIWIRLGTLSFQPGEFAKIVLAVAFAAYFVDKREVLALAGKRVLGIDLPRLRDLGPIGIMWGVGILVLVYQRDLGTSLLFFGLFVMMLYVATERVGWVIVGAGLLTVAAVAAGTFFSHVQRRVDAWLFPFDDIDHNTQIIQAQFGLDWGGLLGRGWGLGSPWWVSLANSDMISTSIAEELGLAGFFVMTIAFAFLAFRGLRTALTSRDAFGTLLAAGLSFAFALQVFVILGGATRLLPLTGLTTPFMAAGGTSLVANWVVVAILMVISHQARRPVRKMSTEVEMDFSDEHTQVIAMGREQDMVPATGAVVTGSERMPYDPAADAETVPAGPAGDTEPTVAAQHSDAPAPEGSPMGEDTAPMSLEDLQDTDGSGNERQTP